jgi:hypothetical protein
MPWKTAERFRFRAQDPTPWKTAEDFRVEWKTAEDFRVEWKTAEDFRVEWKTAEDFRVEWKTAEDFRVEWKTAEDFRVEGLKTLRCALTRGTRGKSKGTNAWMRQHRAQKEWGERPTRHLHAAAPSSVSNATKTRPMC